MSSNPLIMGYGRLRPDCCWLPWPVCRLWADRPGGSVHWRERIRGVQYMVCAIQIDVLTFFTLPLSPMHRATRWRQVCLSWGDASTSSQVNPILWRSLFTVSLQFILGLPGLLLNPATSHCSVCFGMRTSSILVTWPSHRNLLSQITFSRSVCPVLFRISSFVTLPL